MHTNDYGMRSHVMKTWAGDDTSMPIQMWQNIQVGRTQAFPKSPKHKKPCKWAIMLRTMPDPGQACATKTCDPTYFIL